MKHPNFNFVKPGMAAGTNFGTYTQNQFYATYIVVICGNKLFCLGHWRTFNG